MDAIDTLSHTVRLIHVPTTTRDKR